MLDVHAPHQSAHTWMDFFIHIATIVVGLLIAIGLEQSVEAIHHRHQVTELREQMNDVFENNLKLEPTFLKRSDSFRDYMMELRHAVGARIDGHPLTQEPDRNDPRMRIFSSTPSLAPYEAAKQNGTITLLSSQEIRLYNRIEIQKEYVGQTITDWFRAIYELENFEKQFADSPGSMELASTVTTPDLGALSKDELREFRRLIAQVISATDRLRIRTIMFDAMGKAVLDGATNEAQILNAVGTRLGDNPWKELEAKKP